MTNFGEICENDCHHWISINNYSLSNHLYLQNNPYICFFYLQIWLNFKDNSWPPNVQRQRNEEDFSGGNYFCQMSLDSFSSWLTRILWRELPHLWKSHSVQDSRFKIQDSRLEKSFSSKSWALVTSYIRKTLYPSVQPRIARFGRFCQR